MYNVAYIGLQPLWLALPRSSLVAVLCHVRRSDVTWSVY